MYVYSESVFYYDFYMCDLKVCLEFGMLECLLEKGIYFVEWGDEKLEKILKKYDLVIKVVEIKIELISCFYIIKIV